MQNTIAFIVGKKPKRGTIIAEAMGILEDRGVRCRLLLPHEQDVAPTDVADAALVVHRGLSGADDALLEAVAAADIPLCNPWTGVENLHDRAATHRALLAAGLPAPSGGVRGTWDEVREAAAGRSIVVKAVDGGGRGCGVLPDPLPAEPPMAGPYLVEDRITHDGIDRKLYVAGSWVRGLLKPSTLTHAHTTEGEPFAVDASLAELARRATAGLGMHLAGVDVVIGPRGPVVVDVNAFPGFRGVEGAAEAVAEHLLEHAGEPRG